MKKSIAMAVFLGMYICAAAQHDKRFDGLDTVFAKVLKDWNTPGFAVAVVEKNKIIYTKGFGYRDFEHKKPVTARTLFPIASCTKAFTGAMLGMLRDEGKVNFNKHVREYLPDMKFFNDDLNDHVTVKDLMCHRTGLPGYDESWYYFTTQSRDSLMMRIQYMEPTCGLREQWQYNNLMYMLQGIIIERQTGKSYEASVHEKILLPLGMKHSGFSVKTLTSSADAATGYIAGNNNTPVRLEYDQVDVLNAAAGVNSNVAEMANWLAMWIHGGRFNGRQVIPADYAAEAVSSQMVADGSMPDADFADQSFGNYGYGWGLTSYKGHYEASHLGDLAGFSSAICFFPLDSIGIIVLTNQQGHLVPTIVRAILADRALKAGSYDWSAHYKAVTTANTARAGNEKSAAAARRKRNTKPSHAPGEYEGVYNSKAYGNLAIVNRNDSLFAHAQGNKMAWWLRHYHYDCFEYLKVDKCCGVDTNDIHKPLQFNTGITGGIESVSIPFEDGIKPIVFRKMAGK